MCINYTPVGNKWGIEQHVPDFKSVIHPQFGLGHGGLLAVLPADLRLLPVRGREEDHGCGQGDREDPQAAEEEGAKGDQDPPAG